MDDDDEYEQERLANIKRNQDLLKELHLVGITSAPPPRRSGAGPSRAANGKKQAARKVEPQRVQPRRSSNRLAGVEADSETLKRKYEEEAEAVREAQDRARRARHEDHDLNFLLGGGDDVDENVKSALANTFDKIALRHPTLASEILEEMKESKRRVKNEGHAGDDRYKELKSVLNKMDLRSTDKVTKARVYSMVMHPSVDQDLVFVGDKEGNIGIWDPNGREKGDDEEEEEEQNDSGVKTGRSWSLQVHGKSPITCLRLDPIAADSLFSSSYDSTIRMQSLQGGTSREVWNGQEDVLISIFDILAPQSHPSAFLNTPSHGLDERSLWIADHRGGLSHYDIRQASRKAAKTSRWQVCEKKIGGMSINPVISSCISVASLDQQIRLFDVRNLQTLPTTNEAPYNARAVDAEVLELAEEKAQIGSHRAKLACTSVDWDASGKKLVGVSYDDVVKLWDLQPEWLHVKEKGSVNNTTTTRRPKAEKKVTGLTRWIKSEDGGLEDGDDASLSQRSRPEDVLAKPIQIPHNNQTGKWLTLFRARFNANPAVESHFSMGSMVRHAEIWSDEGTLLKSFYNDDYVTAVPAVTCTHPRRVGRLGTGNASGKCTFWAPQD
ncbi:hypothetical protein CBS101457_006663 [Exobasidium rhododendri]|nr:hypothetical protein CBS101457_006663 [Exobasidium rhododendri]